MTSQTSQRKWESSIVLVSEIWFINLNGKSKVWRSLEVQMMKHRLRNKSYYYYQVTSNSYTKFIVYSLPGNEKDYRSNYQNYKICLIMAKSISCVIAYRNCSFSSSENRLCLVVRNESFKLSILPIIPIVHYYYYLLLQKVLANLRNRFWLLPINKVEKILTIRVSARWNACLIILALSFGTSKCQIMSYNKRYGTNEYIKDFRFVLVRVRSCSFRGGFLP